MKKGLLFFYYDAIMYELTRYVPLAQLDRASDYGSEGREFESSAARQIPEDKIVFGFLLQ